MAAINLTSSQSPGIPQPASGASDGGKEHRIHLGFIDSLRALAALYVVISHTIRGLFPFQKELTATYPLGGKIYSFLSVAVFRYGHLAVAVFIVISGYCLMIPLAHKDKMEMEKILPFIKRRAWRILPPYYAAMAVSLLLMALVPAMNQVSVGEWTYAFPAFDFSNIVSHLLLIHHWSDNWILKINPPLWSIGVEWQMYFLMPLLFLPMLRKTGRVMTVLLTAVLGVVLTYACAGWLPRTQDYIHFIALFAAGMVTAQICFAPNSKCQQLRQRFPASWCFLTLAILILTFLVLTSRATWGSNPFIHWLGNFWNHFLVIDYLVTGCFCCLLISLCQENQRPPVRWIKIALCWAPLVFIGHFSYSIYLIHDPILRLVCTMGEQLHFSALTQHIVVWTIGFPFAIFCGYLLYLAVERHFIKSIPVHRR